MPRHEIDEERRIINNNYSIHQCFNESISVSFTLAGKSEKLGGLYVSLLESVVYVGFGSKHAQYCSAQLTETREYPVEMEETPPPPTVANE